MKSWKEYSATGKKLADISVKLENKTLVVIIIDGVGR
jgi:hypothetical protein